MSPRSLLLISFLAVHCMTACVAQTIQADDDLARSTWAIPSHEQVVQQVEDWLQASQAEENIRQRVTAMWEDPVPVDLRLQTLAQAIVLVHPESAELIQLCERRQLQPASLPAFDVLQSDTLPQFAKHHLRVLYGRWLAQHEYYNESLEQIGDLTVANVVTPATLLFYQSVSHHRLLRKSECLPIIAKLLEQEDQLPRRFRTVAKLIRADLEPLKSDSLDEISRLMDNIQVRLGHGRSGTRVRKEEDDVISKLDKMIKDLEKQQQQQQQASASQGSQGSQQNAPSAPMQDSVAGGAQGAGNVDAKQLEKKGGWGDLPPQERQQALQQLGKDYPSHYRDVIEEYFRKLAREATDR